MRAQAKQPLVLRCVRAAQRSPARVATAPRATRRPTGTGRRSMMNAFLLSPPSIPPRSVGNRGVPAQPSVAARAVQRPGPIPKLAHHARCPLVMVLDGGRGDHGDGDHVRNRRLRPRVAPLAELVHRVVTCQQRCAYPFGVHRLLRYDVE